MSDGSDDEAGAATVHVEPGDGILARAGSTLLFFPRPTTAAAEAAVERLVTAFRSGSGFDPDDESAPPHAYVDWHSGIRWRSTIDIDVDAATVGVGCGHVGEPDPVADLTDLVAGTVRAGGFRVVLAARAPHAVDAASATDVAPPEFDELTDLDITLTPLGPVTYPDDDTDRTSQQPFDVRCRNGHINARLTTSCRICGEAIDVTARRGTPRAVAVIACVALPDGRVVPVDQTLVVGRDPQAVAARATDHPRLIRLDAPHTVSRTHVVIRVENRSVTVTDCESRGHSAVVRAGAAAPIALTPWEPTEVSIGDSVHLGGPTTLTIVEPHRPPSADPTERPRDEP